MIISKKQLNSALVWIVISVIESIILGGLQYSEESLAIVSMIVMINIFFQIIIIKKCEFGIVSFFTAFIVMLYLFHFGQVICVAFDLNSADSVVLKQYMTNRTAVMSTLKICINCINAVFIGGLFANNRINNTENYIDIGAENNIKHFGSVLFWISLPFRLFIDISHIIVGYSGGYLAAYSSVSVSGVIGCIASFWYVSLPLLYLAIEEEKKKKVFLWVSLFYMIITMMLSGSRANQMVGLVGLAIVVFISKERRLRFTDVVKYAILGLLVVFLISVIQETRTYGGAYLINNFSSAAKDSINNNFLFNAMNEFGSTIWTPYLVVDGVASLHPFPGETILKSLITVVPNLFRSSVYANIQRDAVIGYILIDDLSVRGIGGSFIAEIYYDFNFTYILFAALFGCIYNSASWKVKNAVKSRAFSKMSISIPFLVFGIFWVRDSFCGFLRSLVWIAILYYIYRKVKFSSKFH